MKAPLFTFVILQQVHWLMRRSLWIVGFLRRRDMAGRAPSGQTKSRWVPAAQLLAMLTMASPLGSMTSRIQLRLCSVRRTYVLQLILTGPPLGRHSAMWLPNGARCHRISWITPSAIPQTVVLRLGCGGKMIIQAAISWFVRFSRSASALDWQVSTIIETHERQQFSSRISSIVLSQRLLSTEIVMVRIWRAAFSSVIQKTSGFPQAAPEQESAALSTIACFLGISHLQPFSPERIILPIWLRHQ
jgi:hypothetical protein